MPACCQGLLIAGTHSGCGKTQVVLALASALIQRGYTVQGFKVGPDFIDPGHLGAITGRPAHNLDGWMLAREAVLDLFERHRAGADFCLVEGVMGLFDGASGRNEAGSTAQMAKWLGLPVVLVVDARAQGRSVAALVRGFLEFDPDLNLAGVVFTKTGGPGHVSMLQEALAAYLPGFPCLGFLPRRPDLTVPSRHLGLLTAHEAGWGAEQRAALSAWVEHGADVSGLLGLAGTIPCGGDAPGQTERLAAQSSDAGATIRLAVARDSAFCFYYQDNLDLLGRFGAELAFFSPMRDNALPRDVQGLYLGGGYPELHAADLSANESMRAAVRQAARKGMPVYAECGGFLYLLAALEDAEQVLHPMAGVFPHHGRMHSRFQALGYREVILAADCILGSKGESLRGHEFHYSGLKNNPDHEAQSAFLASDRLGREFATGFMRGNVLASFIHLHFGSRPQSANALVHACARWEQAG